MDATSTPGDRDLLVAPLHRTAPPATASPGPGSVLTSLQRLVGNAATVAAVQREESPVLDVVGRGGGSALPDDVQREMGAALGADLSGVRIHTGGAAASSAEAIGARAYTAGNEIVFGQGAYDPGSTDGKRTLAHELTHVVQQAAGPVSGTDTGDGIRVSDPSDVFEQEAVAHADHVVQHGSAPGVEAAGGGGDAVQREADLDVGDLDDDDAAP